MTYPSVDKGTMNHVMIDTYAIGTRFRLVNFRHPR